MIINIITKLVTSDSLDSLEEEEMEYSLSANTVQKHLHGELICRDVLKVFTIKKNRINVESIQRHLREDKTKNSM